MNNHEQMLLIQQQAKLQKAKFVPQQISGIQRANSTRNFMPHTHQSPIVLDKSLVPVNKGGKISLVLDPCFVEYFRTLHSLIFKIYIHWKRLSTGSESININMLIYSFLYLCPIHPLEIVIILPESLETVKVQAGKNTLQLNPIHNNLYVIVPKLSFLPPLNIFCVCIGFIKMQYRSHIILQRTTGSP